MLHTVLFISLKRDNNSFRYAAKDIFMWENANIVIEIFCIIKKLLG